MNDNNEKKGYRLTEKGQSIYNENGQKNDPDMRLSGKKKKNNAFAPLPRRAFTQRQSVQGPENASPQNNEPASHHVPQEEGQTSEHDKKERFSESEVKPFSANEPIMGDAHLAQDIQWAVRNDMLLSAVANNIHVAVDNGIVTLEGRVFTKQEKMIVGDRVVAFVGYGKVNNYLDIISPEKDEKF